MSSISAEHLASSNAPDQTKYTKDESDITKTNHEVPAPTIEEPDEARHNREKDDAATMAASEELKHTTISDKVLDPAKEGTNEGVDNNGEDKDMAEPAKAQTPEPEPSDAQDEEMRERISSPKKKRGRDFEEDVREAESVEGNDTGSDGGANGNRTSREEPEKKRPRDTSTGPTKTSETIAKEEEATSGLRVASKTLPSEPDTADEATKPATFGSAITDKPQTSSSAFANSGFASLAGSSSSPFGTLAASKPSVFGGSSNTTTSGFGALAAGKSSTTNTVPTGGFGIATGNKPASGFAFGTGAPTSGFGGLASGSVFGTALGNGFAGGSGPKLSSFAAPTKESIVETKPARAFGAPESDEDAGSDEDDSDGENSYSDDDERSRVSPEEKKKPKIAVKVEDGESGEATLLQIRAKLFALESKEVGWKERGVGSLKINVPRSCVTYDEDTGLPISGSFDLSSLDDEDDTDSNGPRVPRLIMRQENTHRVILNTIIVRAMEFKDKPTTTAAQVLFTAFEGEKEAKPVQMLLKISEANARLFKSEVASIQREL